MSETTALIISENKTFSDLVEYLPEHAPMVKTVAEHLPKIEHDTAFFCKQQSQFMDMMMTVHHPTPLRNARQILAEVNKCKLALQEVHFKNRKKELHIKKLERRLETETDDIERELTEVRIHGQVPRIVMLATLDMDDLPSPV